MLTRPTLALAMTVLMTGLAAAPALAADSPADVSNAIKVKATRLQVEVNCQGEGDRSYGTYGFGGYGCSKESGAAIHCDAKGNCESFGPGERSVLRGGTVKQDDNAMLPAAPN